MTCHIRIVILSSLLSTATIAADPPQTGEPLPNGALLRLGTTRYRSNLVVAIAFTPNGSLLATGGTDSTVRLWQSAAGKSGKQLQCWESKSRKISALAFALDGKRFASAENSVLRIRDAATGCDLHESSIPSGCPEAVEFSSDGKLLAIQVEDTPMIFRRTGEKKNVPPPSAPSSDLAVVAYSAGLRHCAGLDAEQTLHVWETASGRTLGKMPRFGLDGPVAISFDGRLLACTPDRDRPIQLRDVATGKLLRVCSEPVERLQSLIFSPDGRWLASSDHWRQVVRLRDVATGQQRWEFRTNNDSGDATVLRFSPDSKRLAVACGGSGFRVLKVATDPEAGMPDGHQGIITHVSFLGDGRILTAGLDRTIRFWDGESGKEIKQLLRTSSDSRVAVSADGKRLAVFDEGGLKVLDAATGKDTAPLKGEPGQIHCAVFSPSGATLATGGDEEVSLWNLASGARLRRLDGLSGSVQLLCFSSDGRRLAVATRDASISIWDVESGRVIAVLHDIFLGVASMAFMPDGRSLVAVLSEGDLRVWEIVTGQTRKSEKLEGGKVKILAVSPRGRLLAHTGNDAMVRIRDMTTGRDVVELKGHADEVTSLAFSTDGRRLVSGSEDTTALVWKVPDVPVVKRELKRNEVRLMIDVMDDRPAAEAFDVMARLGTTHGLARVVREYLSPAKREDRERIALLIRDLDSPRFRVREKAHEELLKFAERAWPLLQKVLDVSLTLEMRRRVERLLEEEKKGPSPARIRRQRLLELLEMSGEPEAIRILEELAAGDPEAEMTREAREGLARLKRRPR